MIMVYFKTRIYTESEDDIIGAEVLVYSDNGDRIGSIEIVNAEDLNDLREQLSVIDETYFTESRLNAILANAQETTNINATELSGFASSDFAKVTQLSNYALNNHTHVKTNISDLYNYSISCSDYNPTIDSEISVTVKVTNQAGNPVSGQSISIAKNNVAWKNGVTGSNGEFTTTYTCSEWGIVTFSANNNFTQIMVKGWRQLKTFKNTGVIKTNGEQVHIFCNETISNVGSRATYGIGTVTVGYEPSTVVAVEASADQSANHKFIVKADGSISVVNATSSSASIAVWNTIVYPLI